MTFFLLFCIRVRSRIVVETIIGRGECPRAAFGQDTSPFRCRRRRERCSVVLCSTPRRVIRLSRQYTTPLHLDRGKGHTVTAQSSSFSPPSHRTDFLRLHPSTEGILHSLPKLVAREQEGLTGVELPDGVRVGDKQDRRRLPGV